MKSNALSISLTRFEIWLTSEIKYFEVNVIQLRAVSFLLLFVLNI